MNSAGTAALTKSGKFQQLNGSSLQVTKKNSIDSQSSLTAVGNGQHKVSRVTVQNTSEKQNVNKQPTFIPPVSKANAGRLLASYGGAIAESNGMIDRHL